MLTSDIPVFYALFVSIIRFAVEEHGATMETDPATGSTHIDVPCWAEGACLEELARLVGPGKPLNSFLPFLLSTIFIPSELDAGRKNMGLRAL